MRIELELVDEKLNLVVTTNAGDVHRFTPRQSLTRDLAEAVAAEPRLLRVLLPLEAILSPAVVAAVTTSLQLLQESLMRRQVEFSKGLADDKRARVLSQGAILAAATEVMGSEEAALMWLDKRAMGLYGQRPVDLLATTEGAGLVEDFLGRLRHGI